MNEKEFMIEQQKAVERMKEFANRSSNLHNIEDTNIPPTPHFVSVNKKKNNRDENSTESFLNLNKIGFDVPLINKLKNDKDSGLILGLILLLLCDNTDKLTLIALLYILL